MDLFFFNSLSRSLEKFVPIKRGFFYFYSCGPTVYDYSHLGNLRSFVFKDLVYRVALLNNYKVKHICNITDVDDKTIARAHKEGKNLEEFTELFKQEFFNDLEKLKIIPAQKYPKATHFIKEIQTMIQVLIDKGYAYEKEGSVFYSIKKFPNYGKLGRIKCNQQQRGTRTINDEYQKENIQDFALWKKWTEKDGKVKWESPWGYGRPGWHIECSAMAQKLLGKSFDLHTGGIDLQYPHHDNEIAQSEACYNTTYVNYWLHCQHLEVNGEKMAKSSNNFYTLKDIISWGYTPREARYALINAHYRSKLNFLANPPKSQSLEQARASLKRIDEFLNRIKSYEENKELKIDKIYQEYQEKFHKAMNNDLNISKALEIVFTFIKKINLKLNKKESVNKQAINQTMKFFDKILACIFQDNETISSKEIEQIQNKLNYRWSVKKSKNYELADAIKKEINKLGWEVKDSHNKSSATKGQKVLFIND